MPPRAIDVTRRPACLKNIYGNSIPETYEQRLFSVTSPPALLAACKDSRAAALKVYTPYFGNRLERPIYLNTSKDVLAFQSKYVVMAFLRSIVKVSDLRSAGVKFVSVGVDHVDEENSYRLMHLITCDHDNGFDDHTNYWIDRVARAFGTLKKLAIVPNHCCDHPDWVLWPLVDYSKYRNKYCQKLWDQFNIKKELRWVIPKYILSGRYQLLHRMMNDYVTTEEPT